MARRGRFGRAESGASNLSSVIQNLIRQQKAEEERIARENAEMEMKAKAQAEQARLAKEKAEAKFNVTAAVDKDTEYELASSREDLREARDQLRPRCGAVPGPGPHDDRGSATGRGAAVRGAARTARGDRTPRGLLSGGPA